MANELNPNINGCTYAHSSSRIRIDGTVYTRIKSLNYGAGFDGRNHVFGTSIQPVDETMGLYKPDEPNMEMHRQEFDKLQEKFGDELYTRRFPIVVELSEPGRPTVKDIIGGCKIKKAAASSQEGGDPNMVKVDMTCMWVKYNGKPPFPGFRE
jgi:hypothetical protein